jgi:hypothetical protein
MYVCLYEYVCIYAHVCMHARRCMYACIYVCMFACMYLCMYVCTNMYVYTHMYACMHDVALLLNFNMICWRCWRQRHTYTHVWIHLGNGTHTYVCMHVCMHLISPHKDMNSSWRFQTRIHACKHTYSSANVGRRMYVYVCVYTHANTLTPPLTL